MIGLRAKPGRSSLVCERQAAAKRLSVLLADLDGLDAAPDERLLELRGEVSAVLARIGKLDEELARCEVAPLDALISAQQTECVTPRQRRVQARGRLLSALLVLDGLPASCTDAAKLLRRAVKAELRRIEQLRREHGS
jgi:hypothetical protein